MGIVLDSCVIVDLNVLDDSDPRYRHIEERTDRDSCYLTPIEAAEAYYRLTKDVDSNLADMILDAMRTGQGPKIMEVAELVEKAAFARSHGAPPSIAFTAALANKLNASVLVCEEKAQAYHELAEEEFCRIEVY
jgi:hypothetical protein